MVNSSHLNAMLGAVYGPAAMNALDPLTFLEPKPTWRDHTFKIPRKCHYCKASVWGKGRIGYVTWTYDDDVYRAHTACQAMGVLGGDD